MTRRKWLSQASILAAGGLIDTPSLAQKKYGPGANDSEIRIGQTMAYSGPASAYGALGKAASAYFDWVNATGGINGRKVNLLTVDDGFSPPKTVEQTRKLVEQDEVLFMFGSLGTATNTAVQKYLNARRVPQLFLGAGGAKFTDPATHPWTMAYQPNFFIEARVFARYLLRDMPKARIGVLYQNDDLGRDYLHGLKDGLGDRAKAMIVGEQSYEITDPTIDSQILALRAAGADVLFSATTPKFAALALKRSGQIGWKPQHLLTVGVVSVSAVLEQGGLENSIGAIGATYYKDPNDPQWINDAAMLRWRDWMAKYNSRADTGDALNVVMYCLAEACSAVLRQCGNELTRDNVLKQATRLDYQPELTLSGIRVKTGDGDYAPIEAMQLQRFDGKSWQLFGDVVHA